MLKNLPTLTLSLLLSASAFAKVEQTTVCFFSTGKSGCTIDDVIDARDKRVEELRGQGFSVLIRKDSIGEKFKSSTRGSFGTRYYKIHVFEESDTRPLENMERALLRELIGTDALSKPDLQ